MTTSLNKPTRKPRAKNGRMYVIDRNFALVGLRDIPDTIKGNKSAAQLTPIFSITHTVIHDAFLAQLKGDVEHFLDRITLKEQYVTSKIPHRTDTKPDSFGWIDDLELLKKLPYEYTPLIEELELRYLSFRSECVEKMCENLIKNIKIARSLKIYSSCTANYAATLKQAALTL